MGNIDTSGFYKQAEDKVWIYAPNFVYGLNFELLRENKDTYAYPIDGWEWYDENIEIYTLIHETKNVDKTHENQVDL
jgi:hypothetical protein